MVAYFCDYDNDGWFDLVHTCWAPRRHDSSLRSGRGLALTASPFASTATQRRHVQAGHDDWGSRSAWLDERQCSRPTTTAVWTCSWATAAPDDRSVRSWCWPTTGGSFKNVTFAQASPRREGARANAADLHGDAAMSLIAASGGMYPENC